MSALGKRILEFDRQYPGDAGAAMEVPAKVWAELVDLASTEADLLAALREAAHSINHTALCSFDIDTPCQCGADARLKTVRAAIAKAEGQWGSADTRRGQLTTSAPEAQVRASTHPKQASGKGDAR